MCVPGLLIGEAAVWMLAQTSDQLSGQRALL
jgi:hypothetical protein